MKKKVTKKVTARNDKTPSRVKKTEPKKSVISTKKPVKKATKSPVKKENDPLNSKAAIANLRKHYLALDKLNAQRAVVLESISKAEAALAEVLDLNMARVDDYSAAELLKKQTPVKKTPVENPTDLSVRTVSTPFGTPISPTLGALESLNAVARKF